MAAGAALVVAGAADGYAAGARRAERAIDEGQAAAVLERLARVSREG
jgi:anthranilate phosphoribosyltransferase